MYEEYFDKLFLKCHFGLNLENNNIEGREILFKLGVKLKDQSKRNSFASISNLKSRISEID